MLSKSPVQILPHSPQAGGTGLNHPTTPPPIGIPALAEMSAESHRLDGSSTAKSSQTRLEDAAQSEVDSHLRDLVRTTSLEELSRSEHSGSIRTISERDLKEWIKEALRRVISTTTSLGESEREQLLANARHELTAIMRVHQAEGVAHAASVTALSLLVAGRPSTEPSLTGTNAMEQAHITDLQLKLVSTTSQCESFAQRVQDLEHLLQESLSLPHAEVHEIKLLRMQLDARTAEVVKTDAGLDQAKRETRAVAGRLLRQQEIASEEKLVLIDRIAASDRAMVEMDRKRGDAGQRAAVAEAQLHAIQEVDGAHRSHVVHQETEVLRADLAANIVAAETTRARLTDELAQARIETQSTQIELATALQARGAMQIATRRQELEAQEKLIATEHDRQRSADNLLAAKADQSQAEQALGVSGEALFLMVQERDQLLDALQTADLGLKAVDVRVRLIAAERDEAIRLAKTASVRARKHASRAAPTPAVALPNDIIALQSALTRACAVVTGTVGHPREDICGPLAARAPGRWLCVWRDDKGRLKVARTVGDRWLNAGRTPGVAPVDEVEGEPVAVVHGAVILAGWRDLRGHARLGRLDSQGHLLEAPRDLGWSFAGPEMSRGGGDAAIFTATANTQGHVLLHEADGSAAIDLTALLKAPAAAGSPAAWHWPLAGSRHIVYRDAEGSAHEYRDVAGHWQHSDLGASTKAPAAASDPLGYAPADHGHVIYVGVDGHVHELCCDSQRWQHQDLTAIADAPASAGRPYGAYVSGSHCVTFRGLDGQAHLLRQRRDWRHHPLPGLGRLLDDPRLGGSGSEGVISYHGSDKLGRMARFSADMSDLTVTAMPG